MDDVAPASPHDPALPGRVVTRSRTELPVLQSQRSPVAGEAPSIAVAIGYAMATLVWLAFGDVLPGGRWLAVHLFTLGVLTNLVLTFSGHFARAITQQADRAARWWPVVANVGVLAVIVGIPAASRALTATGATILSVAVFASYRRLRRMRRQAPDARFGWIVRVHERAHGAFLHGAILGALLGVGLVPGAWYGGVRIAHLHANLLGWGGLTLLSTLVFFGPSMARARLAPDADARAARALRIGATGLSVAVLLLILTGAGGAGGATARVLAAVALGAFAWAATVVCGAVVRAIRSGGGGTAAPLVIGASVWFVAVAWVDVAVIAAGGWSWLDGLGVAALGGVLAQAILATLLHLAPLLRDRTPVQRDCVRARLEVAARSRAVVFNVGVVLVVGSTVLPLQGLAAGGWGLIGLVVTGALAMAVAPTRRSEQATARHL